MAALQLLFLGAAVDARVPIVRQLPVVDGGGGPLSALKLPLEIAEPLDRHVRSEELSGAQHGEMLRGSRPPQRCRFDLTGAAYAKLRAEWEAVR